MIKVSKLFSAILALGIVAFMASCDTPEVLDPAAPTISFQDGAGNTITEISGEVGESVTFTVSGETEGGFNVLRYAVILGADSTFVEEFTSAGSANDSTFSQSITYTFVDSLVDQLAELSFLVVDDENGQTVQVLDLTTTMAPAPIKEYSAFLLYAPVGDNSRANFFSSQNGMIYSTTDVTGTADPLSITIDLGYYYGASDAASFASPNYWANNTNLNGIFADISGWSAKNSTTFRTTSLTPADFDAITNGNEIANAWDAGTDAGEVLNGLAADQVVAYFTDANKNNETGGDLGAKYGLIKVVSISGTFNDGDGINIEVKIQDNEN